MKHAFAKPAAPDDPYFDLDKGMGIEMSIKSSISALTVFLFAGASSNINCLVWLAQVERVSIRKA